MYLICSCAKYVCAHRAPKFFWASSGFFFLVLFLKTKAAQNETLVALCVCEGERERNGRDVLVGEMCASVCYVLFEKVSVSLRACPSLQHGVCVCVSVISRPAVLSCPVISVQPVQCLSLAL